MTHDKASSTLSYTHTHTHIPILPLSPTQNERKEEQHALTCITITAAAVVVVVSRKLARSIFLIGTRGELAVNWLRAHLCGESSAIIQYACVSRISPSPVFGSIFIYILCTSIYKSLISAVLRR